MMAEKKQILRANLSPEQVATLLGQYVAATKGPEFAGRMGSTNLEVILGIDKKGQQVPAQFRVEVTIQ